MKFLVINAERKLFEGVVFEATLPGLDGEVTVLDDHEPMFLALGKGLVRWRSRVQQTGAVQSLLTNKPIMIRKGLARVRRNELMILV